MVSPATAEAATRSASDSNLRRRKEEKKNGFACSDRGDNELPRLILFFVPAKEMVPPADRHDPTVASILDFRPRLANRCKLFPD